MPSKMKPATRNAGAVVSRFFSIATPSLDGDVILVTSAEIFTKVCRQARVIARQAVS